MGEHSITVMRSCATNCKSRRQVSKERPFKCPKSLCGRTFSGGTALEAHYRYVHQKIRDCPQCNKTFSTSAQLQTHVKHVHNLERKYQCGICKKPQITSSALKYHMGTHLGSGERERNYHCPTCKKTFLTRSHLKDHIRASHMGETPFECVLCQRRFSLKYNLNTHMRSHTKERPFQCTEATCGKSFRLNAALQRHVLSVHKSPCDDAPNGKVRHRNRLEKKERNFQCDFCRWRFATNDRLALHMSSAHTAGEQRSLKCPQCDKTFSRMIYLQRHIPNVHGVKSHVCPRCKKPFSTKGHLEDHVRLVHIRERKFECKLCAKSLCTRTVLRKHMATHLEDGKRRRWSCGLCSKTFLDESYLLRHIHAHTGEKPYPCQACGKAFSHPELLRRHVVVHTGERRYTCDVCSKRFAHRAGLRAHKRVHTDERRHACDVCDKKFKTTTHLRRHVMSCHTGEKPYSCGHCSRSFSERDRLRSHVAVVHFGIRKGGGPQCIFCERVFNSAGHLIQHLRGHIQEAPYFCKFCPTELSSAANLGNHTSLHYAPKRNFTCDSCSKEFATPCALGRHKKSHSRRNSPPPPIIHLCVFCRKGLSGRREHMCHASVLRRWRAHCRISSHM